MNKLKKRDIILILVIAAIALCLLFLGLSSRKHASAVTPAPEVNGQETAEQTVPAEESYAAEADAASQTPQNIEEEYYALADEYLAANPAESYVLVQTVGGVFSPIPLVEDTSFKVNFSDDEYNIVHIGKNSVYMESSTCDNQNCVGEGEVTLENRDTRVLYNMIVCLPHDLLLELIDADEAREYLAQMYQAEAEYSASIGVSEDAS